MKSMAELLYEQSRLDAGWHESRSDSNIHLTIKNSNATVVGHTYEDGIIKGTNQGGSGSLSWTLK